MGGGYQLAPENADPWLTRLVKHFKSDIQILDWTVALDPQKPKLVNGNK
jgi:hypothetical protein